MATRRYRQGLANYRPRTAAQVARKRRPPAAAKKRRATGYARPGSKTADRQAARILGPISKWPSEAVHLRNASLSETLGRPGYEGSAALWREYVRDKQRAAFNRQEKGKRAARPKKPSTWVRVKAHRRARPGRRKR